MNALNMQMPLSGFAICGAVSQLLQRSSVERPQNYRRFFYFNKKKRRRRRKRKERKVNSILRRSIDVYLVLYTDITALFASLSWTFSNVTLFRFYVYTIKMKWILNNRIAQISPYWLTKHQVTCWVIGTLNA